jgi:hypothetical protein
MSYYYKYKFVSPEPVFATIKEEFKSYFDTGAVDDLLFPTYLDKCLKKLGRTTYTITPVILDVCDFEARLPDNFYAVREAWLCAEIPLRPYQEPSSFYSQTATATSIQIGPTTTDQNNSCNNDACSNVDCNGECMPTLIQVVYKHNNEVARSFHRQHLLKPGNISVKSRCDLECANFASSSADSFDIRDNKFVTNFRNGTVYMLMYATDYDEIGNQLIPDNYRIREFVEAFIKYKVVEIMTNQTNDETFNQLQSKLMYYKQMADEAYIMADIEIKKQDVYSKQRRIIKDLNRLNMYELPRVINRTDGRNSVGPFRNNQ